MPPCVMGPQQGTVGVQGAPETVLEAGAIKRGRLGLRPGRTLGSDLVPPPRGDGEACALSGEGQATSAQEGSWSTLCTNKPLVMLVACFPTQLVPILPHGALSPANPGAYVWGCLLRTSSTSAYWLRWVPHWPIHKHINLASVPTF